MMFATKALALNHVLVQLHKHAGFPTENHGTVFATSTNWIEDQLKEAELWDQPPSHESIAALAEELADICAPVVGAGLKAHAYNDPAIREMIRHIRYHNREVSPVAVAYAQFVYLLVANC